MDAIGPADANADRLCHVAAGTHDPPFSFFEYSSGAPREQKAAFPPQWKRVNESTLPYTSTSDFPPFAVTTPDGCSLSQDAKFPPGSFIIQPLDQPSGYLPSDGIWCVLTGASRLELALAAAGCSEPHGAC